MDLSASLRKAVESEAGAELYQNVSNAVLEALDRSCYNTKLSTADKVKFVNSIKAQAEQIVYTLMVSNVSWKGVMFHSCIFSIMYHKISGAAML